MEKVSKKQFTAGAFWKITETVAAKGVSFLISLVLLQILTPDDYGIIAITTTFTSLSDILIDGGFSTALVRKKDVDKYDYSSVFVASLFIATVLYIGMYIGSPFISSVYKRPELVNILRVVGIVLFIQAFASTRNALIHREMKFKLLFSCNLISSVISGIVGILAALNGFGVWSLVIQQLLQQLLATILLFIRLKWKFSFIFKWNRFCEIFKFSVGVMGAALLNYAGGSINNLLVGKVYSLTDLGYSDKGGQLPMQASLYTFSSMSSILLPTLASYQDAKDEFKRILRKVISMTSFLVFPMMLGMMAVSYELICVLFTEKWLPALRIMQFSCIYYIATPFMLINIQVFYALGHEFLRVKTEIIRLFLILVSLFLFVFYFHFSISELACVSAIIAVIIALVTYYEVKKLIDYRLIEVYKDMRKSFLSSCIMFIIVTSINFVLRNILKFSSDKVCLCICVFVGMVSYVLMSYWLKDESFFEIYSMVKKRIKRQ